MTLNSGLSGLFLHHTYIKIGACLLQLRMFGQSPVQYTAVRHRRPYRSVMTQHEGKDLQVSMASIYKKGKGLKAASSFLLSSGVRSLRTSNTMGTMPMKTAATVASKATLGFV